VLTSRERLLCAMRLGTPDRVPVAPFGLGALDPGSALAQELIERTDIFLEVWCGGEQYSGQVNDSQIWSSGDPCLGAAAEIRTHTEGSKRVTTYETPQGPLRSVIEHTGVTTAQTEFPCKSLADAEKILSIPYEPPQIDATNYHRWAERLGGQSLVLVTIGDAVNWVAELFAPQEFCLMWADVPELMIELTETAADRLCYFYGELCKAGAKYFRVYGGEYVSVQLGPEAFQRLVVEPDRRIFDLVRRYEGVVHFHNHGPMTRFYDQLLEIGIDSLDPLEAPPWGDCDIAEAKARIGHSICLVGNIDDMEVLGKYPTEKILGMGRELIEKAGPDGYILAGTSSGTYTEHAARNFLALVELSEQMAG